MTLPKLRKNRAPDWVRCVERGFAPPGWVQVEALTSISQGKGDLDAAKLVGEHMMYVFANKEGEPAATLAIDIGPDWMCMGVAVLAERAYAAGLLSARDLARAKNSWT